MRSTALSILDSEQANRCPVIQYSGPDILIQVEDVVGIVTSLQLP
jgi:hypothetical protein